MYNGAEDPALQKSKINFSFERKKKNTKTLKVWEQNQNPKCSHSVRYEFANQDYYWSINATV